MGLHRDDKGNTVAQIRLNHFSLYVFLSLTHTHTRTHTIDWELKGLGTSRDAWKVPGGPNDRAYTQTKHTHIHTKTLCPEDNPDKTGKREK